jgi:transposase-like protein
MTTISKFARLIEIQKESGLSIRSFCSNEGIAPSTFYYWQKKIRKQSGGDRFIPLVVKSPAATFDQVSQREPIPRQGSDMFLEITYPNGIRLKIKNEMDLSGLRALISLLD